MRSNQVSKLLWNKRKKSLQDHRYIYIYIYPSRISWQWESFKPPS